MHTERYLLHSKTRPRIVRDMSNLALAIDDMTPEELDEWASRIAMAQAKSRRTLSVAESGLWETLRILFPDGETATPDTFIPAYGVRRFAERAEMLSALTFRACSPSARKPEREAVRLLMVRTLKEYLSSFILYDNARTFEASVDSVRQFVVEDKELRSEHVETLVATLTRIEQKLDRQPASIGPTDRPYVGPRYLLDRFTRIEHAVNSHFPGYIAAGMLNMALVPLPKSD